MKYFRLAALSCALTLLVGCTSTDSWNWFAQEPEQQSLIDATPAGELGYTLSWLQDLGIPEQERLQQVRLLGDMLIVIEQQSSTVWALAARDGEVRWSAVVGNPERELYDAIRHDGHVYINSATRLYTLHEDSGELITSSPLESAVNAGPVHFEDHAIFGAINGRIFAQSFRTNYPAWLYKLPDQIVAAPALVGNRVFFADAAGNYVLLDAVNGDRIWRGYTFGPVTAAPVADGQTVYVASEDRSLYALDTRSAGDDRWRYHTETPLTESPAVFQDIVLLPIPGRGAVALDKQNGEVLWEMAEETTQPVLQHEDQLLLSTGRSLELVEARTGALITQAPTQPIDRVMVGPDQSLILIAPDGRIMRLDRVQ